MKKVLLLLWVIVLNASALSLKTTTAEWRINSQTGAIAEVHRLTPDTVVVQKISNRYFIMKKSGDAEASENDDKVTAYSTGNGTLVFQCVNPRLKDMRIVKKYWSDGVYLRREVTFHNTGAETAFVTLRTQVSFEEAFFRDAFYLGSGYIGPLIAAPRPKQPLKESRYKQTTKGILAYHPPGQGSFAQYRTKLNGQFVFPWWQSAIATYIEKDNYLYYLPNGWDMSLGTFDVAAGKDFAVEDCLVFFLEDWYGFLNRIYPSDPETAKILNTLKPGPEWLQNVKVYVGYAGKQQLLQVLELVEDGEVMVLVDVLGNWADYRVRGGITGQKGGFISGEEMKRFIAELKALSPRIRIGIYNWINSVGVTSPIWTQHPEMFMKKDRAGNDKNLFPGTFIQNYPTMINRPETAKFMLDMFAGIIDYLKVDYIYLDETKTTNLVDWERGDIVRDDHWYKFWEQMKHLGNEKSVVMFGNGRGNPYFDLNFIEARHQLAPQSWREFVGMGMAVTNFVAHRPGARLCLLYWNPNLDYINRVLGNSFIPAIHTLRYQQIPFLTANAEIGKTSIADLKYTPDWKNDPKTELETYCTRRDHGGEIVFSAINRSEHNRKVALEIEIPGQENIQIWEYRVDRYDDKNPLTYGLGEKDIRRNYRQYRWREGLVTTPRLVYQGKNPGTFRHEFTEFGNGELRQLVISKAIAGVYAVNAMPVNYFLATVPQVRISGGEFPIRVESQAENAEIILFGAPGKVTVNGQAAAPRYAKFGGQYYPLATVQRGVSTIDLQGRIELKDTPFQARIEDGQIRLKGSPELVTIKRGGKLLYCGNAPTLPEHHAGGELEFNTPNGKLTVPAGKPTAAMQIGAAPLVPVHKEIEPLTRELDGAKIISRAAYTAAWHNVYGIQESLPPAVAVADGAELYLEAGTTTKIIDFLTHAYAGFLLNGANKVQLRLEHTFASNSGIERGHVSRYRRSPLEFAGIMLDYQTAKGFRRVAFSAGVANPNGAPGIHPWGAERTAVQVFDLGKLVDQPSPSVFTLDLKRYAPTDWTGAVWITTGTSWVKPGRKLKLTLEHCNRQAVAPVIEPVDRAMARREFQQPKNLSIPVVQNASFENIFRNGAVIPKLFLLANIGYPVHQSSAAIGRDERHLYVAIQLQDSNPQAENQLEVWLKPQNGKTIQIMIDHRGVFEVNRNGQRATNIPIQVQKTGTGSFLISIPIHLCGSGDSLKFNICRIRPATVENAQELSTWAPLGRSFNETGNFGTLFFSEIKTDYPVEVFNCGKGGYTAGQVAGAPLRNALQLKPTLAVLMVGTNDMVNSTKLTDYPVFENNLNRIINGLRNAGAEVVLSTIPPCSEKLLFLRHKPEAFKDATPTERIIRANQVIRKIAGEQNIPLVDLYSLISEHAPLDSAESLLRNPANVKSADGVHLTAEGAALFGREVAKTIKEHRLNTTRIVCIGDSNTFGASLKGAGTVEREPYPAVLRRELCPDFNEPTKQKEL